MIIIISEVKAVLIDDDTENFLPSLSTPYKEFRVLIIG